MRKKIFDSKYYKRLYNTSAKEYSEQCFSKISYDKFVLFKYCELKYLTTVGTVTLSIGLANLTALLLFPGLGADFNAFVVILLTTLRNSLTDDYMVVAVYKECEKLISTGEARL